MNEGVTVWSTLFLLGAYHGINPGMGWLFAVARGMQEHRARALLRYRSRLSPWATRSLSAW
jgi:threonine/homoserine/homoserine lactone efflux protein